MAEINSSQEQQGGVQDTGFDISVQCFILQVPQKTLFPVSREENDVLFLRVTLQWCEFGLTASSVPQFLCV